MESGIETMQDIMRAERELPETERLTVHVIGFGPHVIHSYVEQLAALGGGSHMVCQGAHDTDRIHLIRAFTRIAAQPALQVALVPDARE